MRWRCVHDHDIRVVHLGRPPVPRVAVPIIDSPEHVQAAEAATRKRNAGFMTVMLEGLYTDAYLASAGGQPPKFIDRVMFLRACLGQLQRAASEGVPVDGYSCGAPRTTSSGSTATATAS